MPRELHALSSDEMALREYEVPEVGEGQIQVQTKYAAAKHGTEQSNVKGTASQRGRLDPKLKIFPAEGGSAEAGGRVGNMFVGTVTEVGAGVDSFVEGDDIAGYGPFREVHVVSAGRRCWKMPEGFSWKSAVCLDPAILRWLR